MLNGVFTCLVTYLIITFCSTYNHFYHCVLITTTIATFIIATATITTSTIVITTRTFAIVVMTPTTILLLPWPLSPRSSVSPLILLSSCHCYCRNCHHCHHCHLYHYHYHHHHQHHYIGLMLLILHLYYYVLILVFNSILPYHFFTTKWALKFLELMLID